MKVSVAFAAGLLLAAPAARAQDPIMALDPTLMAGWSGNTGNAAATPKSTGTRRPATAPKPAARTNFAYTSTPALRQQTVARLAKRLQATNAATAQALTAAYGPGKTDYGLVYRAMLKSSGLRDNDAADALAGFLVVGYQVVNDVKDEEITPVMERGARAQVAAVMAQNPQLAAPATRAQAGEEFKLQSVVVATGWQEAVQAGTQAAYQQSIAALFKNQYHMDLARLRLSAQGFGKQ